MPIRHDMVRVLHDPVGYYRPWEGRLDGLMPTQRGALNRWLAHTYALPGYAPPGAAQEAATARLVAGWPRIPATAWLMACAKQRNSVLGSRLVLQQPPVVQTFLMLGFTPAPAGPVLDAEALLAWGGDHLQAGLRDHLPAWLVARIGLWFSGLPRSAEAPSAARTPFDLTCFWSAWNHAADLSGPIAGLCR